MREMGVPVLLGTETGLRATRHLIAYHEWQRHRVATEAPAAPQPANREELRQQLMSATGALDEHASKLILEAYGISTTREVPAATLDEALQAATEIGYPVALKSAGGDLHKSESGGVRLNLETPDQLSDAYRDIENRLGPLTLVQEMIQGGTELILGVVVDPQFGPMLTLGTGGIFVEVLRDVTMLSLPTTRDAVRDSLRGLRGAAILQGARGRAPADMEAIVSAAMGLGALALGLGDVIGEIDVNPLIALPDRAVAVDALIVPANTKI
jgi:acyl-CoA synthetase (NDP forming)